MFHREIESCIRTLDLPIAKVNSHNVRAGIYSCFIEKQKVVLEQLTNTLDLPIDKVNSHKC